ncbi:MAG: alpha/beta fold hydrolase [Paracoccaceae bacterium]
MPELDLPDLRLHYEDEGTGPPLLMLAGMMSDGASWTPLVAPLAPHARLIRPDNRSTGRTRPLEAPVSVEAIAADALALLDALGIERARVLGHSMGGMVALQLAAQAPDRVAELALLASAPVRSARNLHLFRSLLALRADGMPPDLWLRALFPWLFHAAAFDAPEAIEAGIRAGIDYPHAQPPSAMARQVEALERFAPAGLAARVRAPVLALRARDDLLIPEPEARAALAPLSDLRVETIPRAGHSVHWDRPDAVAAHLLRWLGVSAP